MRFKISADHLRALLPQISMGGFALLITLLALVVSEPRICLGFGVIIGFAQFLWGAAWAGSMVGVFSLISLGVAAKSGNLSLQIAVLIPVYLAAVWWVAVWIARLNTEDSLKVKLAQESQEQDLLKVEEQLEKERLRIAASRERIEKLLMLTEVANSLSSTLEVTEVISHALTHAEQLTGQQGEPNVVIFESGTARIYRMTDNILTFLNEEPDPFSAWVRERLMPLYVPDLSRDMRFRGVSQEMLDIKSVIATPLMKGRSAMGVLIVKSGTASAFTAEDWRLLSLLGDLVDVALQNAFLYHRTQEEAITDGLTEVNVHRYFQERLVEEFQRSKDMELPLTLLMADIDNFKNVNDTFGHLAGDTVLKRIARVMRDCVRGTDMVARYGGEEFAVLLVETARESARLVAERLRTAVKALDFSDTGINSPVTISIGLACFPEDASDERSLIEQADSVLYQAKRLGKDRVVCASG